MQCQFHLLANSMNYFRPIVGVFVGGSRWSIREARGDRVGRQWIVGWKRRDRGVFNVFLRNDWTTPSRTLIGTGQTIPNEDYEKARRKGSTTASKAYCFRASKAIMTKLIHTYTYSYPVYIMLYVHCVLYRSSMPWKDLVARGELS